MKPLLAPLQALARLPAYLWALALVLPLLLALAVFTRVGDVPGAVRVDQALVWQEGAPPGAEQSVTLPHVWHQKHLNWNGQATYRVQLPADAQAAALADNLALLLPRVGVHFRVLLNGQELAAECWRRGPGFCDAGTRAHVVLLPRGLMQPDWQDNRIEVQLQGRPLRISGLSAMWVGPRDALVQRHRWLDWWQVDLTWMVTASAFMMGMLSLLVWLRTSERLFGLLGGGLLVLTARLWLSTPVFVPGPFALWDYVHKLSFTWYCGFIYLYMSELFDFRQGVVRRLVVAMMAAGPLWLLAVSWTEDYQLYRWWTGVILLVCLAALLAVIHRDRRGMGANQRLMVVVGLAVMVTGLRDFLVVQLGLPGDVDIRWMTPGSLVLMFAMGWVLVRRTAGAIEQAGRHNAELASKVQAREAELRDAFARLRVVENQRVLDAERRRLTRDMHDGLGSQLVQTLNLVRASGQQIDSAAVATMLHHALEELRLTLDSLEPMDGDLPSLLGTLRQRVGPSLQAVGIELDWRVEDVPPIAALQACGAMHLFRCLQEVFANVVKHSHARRVTVRTWTEDHCVYLSVCDDGVGLGALQDATWRSGGRGLGHIRLRAAEIGAEVQFVDAAPGTCVKLRFAAA